MCFHCCHLRSKPCPTIPYSCPHCSVHEIVSACSILDRKQYNKRYSEHKWYMARKWEKNLFPCICNKLPPRWLDVNRNLIFEFARSLGKSPESIHYMLLRLLHANYSQVMRILKKRRSFEVPLVSRSLLFSPTSLIDNHGNLSAPMHPESVEKLLRLIQDYLHRMQLLNRKYKWFNNGLAKGDLVGLLGKQDELLKLFSSLFGVNDSQGLFSVRRILQAINDLPLKKVFHKGKTQQKSKQFLKTISDLYSEVAAENPSRPKTRDDASTINKDPIYNVKTQHSFDHLQRNDSIFQKISLATADCERSTALFHQSAVSKVSRASKDSKKMLTKKDDLGITSAKKKKS